jgi:hypothetical protein
LRVAVGSEDGERSASAEAGGVSSGVETLPWPPEGP